MEADISIWRKPGHFYFALTPVCPRSALVLSVVGATEFSPSREGSEGEAEKLGRKSRQHCRVSHPSALWVRV
jgi:hypothetical protein